MPPVGFEPTISAGERPQTYSLDRAATGTGLPKNIAEQKYTTTYQALYFPPDKHNHSCCFYVHYAMTLVVLVLVLLVVEPSRLVQNYVLEFYSKGTRFRSPRGRW